MSGSYWCGFVAASVFLRNLESKQGSSLFFRSRIRKNTPILGGMGGDYSSWNPTAPDTNKITNQQLKQEVLFISYYDLHCSKDGRAQVEPGCKGNIGMPRVKKMVSSLKKFTA